MGWTLKNMMKLFSNQFPLTDLHYEKQSLQKHTAKIKTKNKINWKMVEQTYRRAIGWIFEEEDCLKTNEHWLNWSAWREVHLDITLWWLLLMIESLHFLKSIHSVLSSSLHSSVGSKRSWAKYLDPEKVPRRFRKGTNCRELWNEKTWCCFTHFNYFPPKKKKKNCFAAFWQDTGENMVLFSVKIFNI